MLNKLNNNNLRVEDQLHFKGGMPVRYLYHEDENEQHSAIFEVNNKHNNYQIIQQHSPVNNSKLSIQGNARSKKKSTFKNQFESVPERNISIDDYSKINNDNIKAHKSQSHPNFEILAVGESKLPQIMISENNKTNSANKSVYRRDVCLTFCNFYIKFKIIFIQSTLSDTDYYGELKDKFGSESALNSGYSHYTGNGIQQTLQSTGSVISKQSDSLLAKRLV